MNRTRSFGRMFAWILLVACVLASGVQDGRPVAAPSATTEPEAIGVSRLTSLEATPGDDSVRVFLGANGPVNARSFLLDTPDRLVVDLDGVEMALKTDRIDVASTKVSRVRVGQRMEGTMPVSRVVLDLKSGAQPYNVATIPGGLVVTVGQAALAADTVPVTAGIAGEPSIDEAFAPDSEAREHRTIEPGPVAVAVATHTATLAAPASAPEPHGAKATVPVTKMAALTTNVVPVTLPIAERAPSPGDLQKAKADGPTGSIYESKKITDSSTAYTGKKISLNLVDADIKQVFRLFHEISGLNFVLDPSVAGNVTVVLDEVPWDQALDIILKNNGLDKVYEENVIRIATTAKLASEAGGRKALKEAKELEVEPVTITRRLSYAKSQDIDTIIKTGVLLSSRGKSFFDNRTNTLIVTDVPAKIEPLDRLITALDEKTPQVMIEARIVLTGRDFIQDLGIDWGFTADRNAPHTPIGPNFPNRGDVSYNLNLPRAASSSKLAFNLFNRSGSFNLNVALDALETDGKSRTISAPKIATQNNVKAEIEQGIQIPITIATAVSNNVQFVAASLRLTVLPQITAEGTVIMDITVENNQPSKTIIVNSVPGIDTQRAQTKVMVDDGGTTVIGGIFSVTESRSESGVPWFRKIPVFGWLFKSRNVTTQNRELLIFITPKILRSV